MKKLLTILGTISTIGPSSLAVMAMTSTTNISPQKTVHDLDSFKNIIKAVNFNVKHDESINSDLMDKILSALDPDFYQTAVSEKDWNNGNVLIWNTTPRDDMQIIKSYEDTYKNNTNTIQLSKTQSRTETVTETHEFSMNLTETISTGIENKISGKISIPLGGIESSVSFNFGVESGSEKKWSDTKTTSVSETVPSQEIKQNPHTILHVKYLIKQGTLDYNGVAQFKIADLISKVIRIPIFWFAPNGMPTGTIIWESYSINDIVKILKDEGYSDQLIDKKDKYSVITVDEINNPRSAILNLPITWSSQTSGIDLEYYEEPIK